MPVARRLSTGPKTEEEKQVALQLTGSMAGGPRLTLQKENRFGMPKGKKKCTMVVLYETAVRRYTT